MKRPFLAPGAALGVVGAAALLTGCGGPAFMAGSSEGGASTPADAAAAGEGGEAGPVEAGASWCTGHTETFCEDFDEYASITNLSGSPAWPVFEQVKGSFKLDTVTPKSPPSSLEVSGDDGAQVLIVKTFPALHNSPVSARLAFDLRVNGAGSVGALSVAGFAAIAFGTSINDSYVAMAIAAGPSLSAIYVPSAAIDGGAPKPAVASGGFPSPGVWNSSYAIEITFGSTAAMGCVQVYRGPSPLLSPCLPLPPQDSRVLSIALGDATGGTMRTGQVDLEFDNVTFDVK